MLYHKKPKDYVTEMEVVGCIIEHWGETLLIRRSSQGSFGGTWSEPGGKVDPGETNEQAMIREIYEETSITLQIGQAERLFKKYFHFVDLNIAITFYKIVLEEKPEIILSPEEHDNFVWATPEQALGYELIEDFDEVLKELYEL